jgi:hypothetical protein
MGCQHPVENMKPGDIVLIYNQDTSCVDGIAIFNAIENGKIYRTARRPLYNEKHAKYNTFEIGVNSFRIQPVPLQTINRECGRDVNSRIITCLQNKSFVRNPTLAPWANRILIQKLNSCNPFQIHPVEELVEELVEEPVENYIENLQRLSEVC